MTGRSDVHADQPIAKAPDRNLALELVRVTEAAAMVAGHWVSRGDKNSADGAAVNAMRQLVHTLSMNGIVVIGEGEDGAAPMLFNGEHIGDGRGPDRDVAVDPIDGTRLTALDMGNALSVMAVSPRGSLFGPSAVFYGEARERSRVGGRGRSPAAGGRERTPGCTRQDGGAVRRHRRDPGPPRYHAMVEEIRTTGARINFITDGDVTGAITAAREGTGLDLLVGIDGTPEGIIAACAIKTLGGAIQGRPWPADDDERQKGIDAGHHLDRVLVTDEMVRGEDVFFAANSSIDGELLKGARYGGGTVRTNRSSCDRAAGRSVSSRGSTGSTSCEPIQRRAVDTCVKYPGRGWRLRRNVE